MYDIRLVGLDLDGTVFDDHKNITPRTVQAIAEACRRGVIVLPATGRNASGVPKQFTEIPGVRYALTSNGAAVVELATGKKLVSLPFAIEDALRVYDVIAPFGGQQSFFVDGKSYSPRGNVAASWDFIPNNMRPYFKTTRLDVDDIRTVFLAHAHEVEKFSILYPDQATCDAAWQAVHAALPTAAITSSLTANMEINAPGVDKGRGLLALAEALGLRRDQVMAVGDSGNDLEMLRAAGLGVAMGNASDEIKAMADAVTADNNHDGVALALETYVLKG